MIEIDPLTLHALTGALLPILLGFLLRQDWTSKVKQVITMIVSTAVSFLLNAVNEDGYAVFSLTAVAWAVIQLVIAVATYVGFYEKTVNPNKALPDLPVPSAVNEQFSKAA